MCAEICSQPRCWLQCFGGIEVAFFRADSVRLSLIHVGSIEQPHRPYAPLPHGESRNEEWRPEAASRGHITGNSAAGGGEGMRVRGTRRGEVGDWCVERRPKCRTCSAGFFFLHARRGSKGVAAPGALGLFQQIKARARTVGHCAVLALRYCGHVVRYIDVRHVLSAPGSRPNGALENHFQKLVIFNL